jgi:hypothetical protein
LVRVTYGFGDLSVVFIPRTRTGKVWNIEIYFKWQCSFEPQERFVHAPVGLYEDLARGVLVAWIASGRCPYDVKTYWEGGGACH